MSDDLRAAAELRRFAEQIVAGVRKTVSEYSTEYAVVNHDAFVMGLMEPYELADAWLAEHPADDAEIATREWCRKVRPGGVGSRYAGDYWMPEIWGISQWVRLPNGATRGDVRTLCRALGIELKEPTP